MGFSTSRIASHPPYDYGFFGDDPTNPTFLFCVDQNGKTVSRYVDPTTASALVQSKLASNKRIYFGPTKFVLDPLLSKNIGAGLTFVTALDYSMLTDVVVDAHPGARLSLKSAAYSGGASGYVFANYLLGNSRITFRNIVFDGNYATITGANNSGFLFNDNTVSKLLVENNHLTNCGYGQFGDPNEFKAGTCSTNVEWDARYVNNIVESSLYGFCVHNGAGGCIYNWNTFNDCSMGLWVDSCCEVQAAYNKFRECHFPIYIMDGVWYGLFAHNIIGPQQDNVSNYAITVTAGGGGKPECAYLKFDHNIIFGHRFGIQNDSAVNIEAYNNTFIQGAATAVQAFVLVGTGKIIGYGNQGGASILPGELRTYSGSIATLTQNAYNSLNNPFGQAVALENLEIYISTGTTDTESIATIDCGIGSSATTDYTTLFEGIPAKTAGFYKSIIATPGTQTLPILWATGSGNRYLNMSIKDAAATGMVATYVATVRGL